MDRREAFAERWIRPVWPVLFLTVLVVTLTVLTDMFGSEVLRLVLLAGLVNLVLVVGLYIFIGNSGIFSFGHMAFMAIGAYTSAIVSISGGAKTALLPDLPGFLASFSVGMLPSMLIAGAVAAVVAFVVGIPLMRLSGIEAGIATLALLLVTQTVIANWDAVTRGTSSMVGVPVDLGVYDAMLFCIAAIAVAYLFQVSRWGLRLRASREDEVAAKSNGIAVVRERTIAFVLSAFVCGFGGAMLAHFLGALRPDDAFFLNPTFLTTAMLVIGGIRSLTGAVVGVIVVSALTEGIRQLEQGTSIGGVDLSTRPGLNAIILGAIMIVILVRRPQGLVGSHEIKWPWSRAGRGGAAPPAEPSRAPAAAEAAR